MRIRKLRIFTVFFIALVLLAAYGLALLRTYTFKPPPEASAGSAAVTSLEDKVNYPAGWPANF